MDVPSGISTSSAVIPIKDDGESGALSAESVNTERGYPLKVLEGKPDEKLCCSYCRLLLRDPVQNGCGHRFCQVCVQVIQRTEKPPVICQSCQDEGTTDEDSYLKFDEMFDDKAARREMKKLPAICINQGCTWKGTFIDFVAHDKVCEKKMVACPQCHVTVSKAKLTQHTSKSCPKRTVECNYCKEMIVYDNMEIHHKTCTMFVIKCEGCGAKISRQEKTEHQKKACTNRPIICPVPSCRGASMPLSQFPTHMAKESSKQDHLTFLLEQYQTLSARIETLALREDNQQTSLISQVALTPPSLPPAVPSTTVVPTVGSDGSLLESERSAGDGAQAEPGFQTEDRMKLKLHEDLMAVLHAEILRCISSGEALTRGVEKEEKRVRDLYTKMETLESRVTEVERRSKERSTPGKEGYGELSSDGSGSFTWQIPSFSGLRQNAHNNIQSSVNSPSFFSEPSGYKMRLTLFPDGKGTYRGISLYLEIVTGPFDDLLVWPFTGKVYFMLVDQMKFNRHHVRSFVCPEHAASQRTPGAENVVLGMEDFIPYEVLSKNVASFIVGDKMFVKMLVEPSAKVKDRITSLDPRKH